MNKQFWSFILPVYLFLTWLIFGAGIAYYYWLKGNNQKAIKWFCYSLLILWIVSFLGWICWRLKSGQWFFK